MASKEYPPMSQSKNILDLLAKTPGDRMQFVLDTVTDLSAAKTPRDFRAVPSANTSATSFRVTVCWC
jgi:hypothetical protein